MRTTIDEAGRLVIPRDIRRKAGLKPGTTLDVCWRDGRIEIEPASVPMRLVRKGHLLVAVPETEIESLHPDQVEETREALQRERASRT